MDLGWCVDLQSGYYFPDHGSIEGVVFLRSVELDGADTVEGVEMDIVSVVAGLFFEFCIIVQKLEAVSRMYMVQQKRFYR